MGIPAIGLYIHIPFCKAKCYYCDFNSFAGRENEFSLYFNALKREIAFYAEKLRDSRIKTVFIGGGTPSFTDAKDIYEVIRLCMESFRIEGEAEITIETNPGTLDADKLVLYRAAGINRISMGLQAWQNPLLKALGRIHSREEFLENLEQAKRAGFENINADLIFGLPGQTLQDWNETLSGVAGLGLTHVSCYSLKIEEGTLFGRMLEAGELAEAEDELDREMYHGAIEKLGKAGFEHYEISNFAKPGCECRHNLVYWNAEEYLGVGAGAHSYLEGKRFNNLSDIGGYISRVSDRGSAGENVQVINEEEKISEFVFLGLRLTEGISLEEFKARFDRDFLEVFGGQVDKLLKKKLITMENGRVRLSPLGLDLANQVFVEFV